MNYLYMNYSNYEIISSNVTFTIANQLQFSYFLIVFIVIIKLLRQSLSPKFHCLHDNVATSPTIQSIPLKSFKYFFLNIQNFHQEIHSIFSMGTIKENINVPVGRQIPVCQMVSQILNAIVMPNCLIGLLILALLNLKTFCRLPRFFTAL